MPESAAAIYCPAVPPHGSGTAGQPAPGTDKGGTASGTIAGTARLKTLEKLASLRDRQRDRDRDNTTDGASALSHPPESRRESAGTVLTPVSCPVPPGQPARPSGRAGHCEDRPAVGPGWGHPAGDWPCGWSKDTLRNDQGVRSAECR